MLCFCKMEVGARLPERANLLDAGWDVFSTHPQTVPHGCVKMIHTGIHLDMTAINDYRKDPICGFIKTRSSFAQKGYIVVGGVIDAGYTGEVMVCMMNTTNRAVTFEKGDKIAQIVFMKLVPIQEMKVIESLPMTERGDDGFGSSGGPQLDAKESALSIPDEIARMEETLAKARQFHQEQLEMEAALAAAVKERDEPIPLPPMDDGDKEEINGLR